MTLDELQQWLKTAGDAAARDAALRDALTEMGTAMADVLQHLEKTGPDIALAVGQALSKLKFDAPQVQVNVQPTPVTVQVAAPNVTFQAPSGGLGRDCDIDFVFGHGGVITGAKVRQIPVKP